MLKVGYSTVFKRGRLCSLSSRCLSTTSVLSMPIKVGEKLPSVVLYEGNPENKVNTSDLFSKGKCIIFGIPGAFTPTCTKSHAPGFIENSDELKAKGITTIACVSVNDPFVMDAWGKSLSAEGKVRMLADTNGEFTKKIDMELDLTGPLGGIRSRRYAMIVKDGVVEAMNAEPGGRGFSCSAAEEVIKLL
ncbi:peroxiredoxin-5, mitochondrial-like isoform X2 [Gigantopelta aegis]|uniref:peroxiredoxin-5, mitochondrial-like isoform X2 n=1 Tax=Gigantopelta aegis TaxID=1735272 RepID=UPI001B88DF4D|nr:peroxiredoxin-5, mitochondrial-like isoform X2 [Gigantopelta aegis]XP_041355058.1 peroxiredoxin-5, mitochondrial-like isoform X2 [Gigantopelta aegis]